ncbi:MAG TPA: ATP-binding cassette domain-containing protein [Spirochaetia bacterium]|nr:ATP-binding cassette domain-containing protein [Spirochaetia bacterium]
MGSVVEVSGLVKRYGALTAVDGVSFNVEEGALFAFLGPNGAGKSTTIGVMCTTLGKNAGTVRVNGFDLDASPDDVRRSIGVVFQHSVLDNLLTVRENLAVRASFYALRGSALKRRVDELSDSVGLRDFLDRRYGELSGGQRRRADVARALLHKPRILFLDEPTTGLDPQTRLKVWRSLAEMQRGERMTVFLTTHYMEEAAEADDVAIVDHGHVVARGTPAALKQKHSSDTLVIVPREDAADGAGRGAGGDRSLERALSAQGLAFTRRADTLVVTVRDSLHALSILKTVEPQVASFEVIKGSMDAVFMNVTGHAIRGEEEP